MPHLGFCGYVGAAASKSLLLGSLILATSYFFVPVHIQNPLMMGFFLILTCITFSLLGFIIGVWADNFEQLQLIPLLVITPLVFLGGSFYTIDMLPPIWQKISLFNPVLYLISGFRWSFYGSGDVTLSVSFVMIGVFLAISLFIIRWIFKTGFRFKS